MTEVSMSCGNCGYDDEYNEGYADEELFPDGLECPFCKDGRLKAE